VRLYHTLNTYVKRNLKENHSYLHYLQEKCEKTLEQALFLMLKPKKIPVKCQNFKKPLRMGIKGSPSGKCQKLSSKTFKPVFKGR